MAQRRKPVWYGLPQANDGNSKVAQDQARNTYKRTQSQGTDARKDSGGKTPESTLNPSFTTPDLKEGVYSGDPLGYQVDRLKRVAKKTKPLLKKVKPVLGKVVSAAKRNIPRR